jgi:hypothetical protein
VGQDRTAEDRAQDRPDERGQRDIAGGPAKSLASRTPMSPGRVISIVDDLFMPLVAHYRAAGEPGTG